MKFPIIVYAVALIFLFSLQEEEVRAQVLTPSLYGGPLSYYNDDSEDDIGLLLAVLLLAARNRGGGNCCGGCCNYCNARTVPVPYPIPFPTNNAIIQQSSNDEPNGSTPDNSKEDPTQVINVDTENDDESKNDNSIENDPSNTARASSSSSSSASAGGVKKPVQKNS